jgi:chromosome segregation ATPase
MTKRNKREDVLASLDAALAGKVSPLAGGKKEVLAEQAAATPAGSSSPTVTADLSALAATTADPVEPTTAVMVPVPTPAQPVQTAPAEVVRLPAPAKPTLVSQPIAPPASVPQAEPKTPEAEKADKRAAVAKIVEEAVAKRLKPLMDEIESLKTQLGNVTKIFMGNIGLENMSGVLEAVEQNGGVLENLDAVDALAKEAGAAAGAAKSKTEELESRFGELDKRVVSLDTEVGTLSGTVESLNTEVGTVSGAANAAQDTADAVGKKASALESGVAQLKTLVLSGIPDEMIEKLLEIVGSNGGLYVQVDGFQDKVAELDSKTTQIDGSIAEVDRKVGSVGTGVETLGKKVGAIGSSVTDLSSDVGGLRSKLETVEDLAKRANGKADSAVDLSGDVLRLSTEVLQFDKRLDALGQRVQAEGQDHVAILQHELVGLLLPDQAPSIPEVAEFIKANDPERVKAALVGLNGSPKLIRNLVIDMTRSREINGITSEQIAEPGDDVIAKSASAHVAGKTEQVTKLVDYILGNWEKF